MRFCCCAFFVAGLVACESTTANTTPDAAPADVADAPADDVTADKEPDPCAEEPEAHVEFQPAEVFLTAGTEATLRVNLARDRCAPLSLAVASSTESVATVASPALRYAAHESTQNLVVRAASLGDATVRAGDAELRVHVRAAGTPACPTTTAPVTGRLAAGMTVRGAAGTPLADASVGLQAAASEVAALDVSLRCAADQVPDGYVAIGPAVRFDPTTSRLPREVPFAVPVNSAMVPTGYEMQVQMSYASPAFRAPRVVPVADLHLTDDGKAITFRAPRLGTWQAVIRRGLGTTHARRRLTYHGVLGVSMGAAGAGMIGGHNLDRFDFVAPLGGPVDWAYQGNYIRTYHVGGFCTAAQRAADPAGCARGSSADRTPPVTDLYERRQHFEEWFYPDGYEGQGGTFDRYSYIQLFRDLTRMFGNAVMPAGATGVLPLGVPDAELTRTDAQRCATPVTLMNYYDATYNPDGSLPVITFCDGTSPREHRGVWDGTAGTFPMEVTLAVDVNRNGRRDAGEPLLQRSQEPFSDVGPDGLPSAREPGYDAATNLDPAGDDYDRQFNPGGTEGNYVHDEREPYQDVGVDGMACPAGRTCPYDTGEGNGRFDLTPGGQRFLDVNPRGLVARAPAAALQRTEFWVDGGVHDLFLFAAVGNHYAGAFAQRGLDLHYYNNFASLGAERVPESPWPFTRIDWARMPGHVMLRYGSVDATQVELLMGDGAHVGTVPQIANRLFASVWWMQSRWPGGDRVIARPSPDSDNAGRCANGSRCTFDFHSDRANRTGPVSIYLPPGYHDPENANVRYPVVFFLHGYGQQPQDLLATGLLIGNYMVSPQLPSWQRPQKFIMVFPDGRCREGDGCLRGTFFTDSAVGNAQMESYFLDLYDFVDSTYRVKQPEEVDVVQ